MKLSEPNIRLVINDQEELSMKLFAFSWMDGELCEPFQELGKMAAQLEEENAALKRGAQDIRDISGTEWGRREMDSPWGKALFLIMQKCEALLADTQESE